MQTLLASSFEEWIEILDSILKNNRNFKQQVEAAKDLTSIGSIKEKIATK